VLMMCCAGTTPWLVFRYWKPGTTLVTGAPLKNMGALLKRVNADHELGDWVCQGGFAGANVVPEQLQLPK
jgi:hypothetical protein